MTTHALPDEPFALVEQPAFEVAGRSEREAFGVSVEVVSIPGRAVRLGKPGADRPVFQRNRAEQILREEAVWRAPGMALTGNRFPFAARQLLLWSTERRREPTQDMLEVAFAMEDQAAGTSVVNSMGASGSIARSHVHVIGDRLAFFSSLPQSELAAEVVHLTTEQLAGCELLRLDPPFPILAVGVRGSATARAAAMHHLLECRTTQAFNILSTDGAAWLVPRRVEIPAPHYQQALGGCELGGRWCCNDPATYERLSTTDMEEAIRICGFPSVPEPG